jgi:cellulose synthase/poly-beta-1,6-N-acetylglucosamine synthase-like glycosyltransferase
MSTGAWISLAPALLFWPLLLAAVDVCAGVRGRHARPATSVGCAAPVEDFEVLVPIYGSIAYLQNVEYLRAYGSRVVLCTATGQDSEFDEALDAVAAANSFRVFRGQVPRQAGRGRRATGGTIRDRLVRDALAEVQAPYVVCIDADTTTTRPLGELVGAMADRHLDLASIRLVPSNGGSLLARLQRHEYHLAMLLRQFLPWLVSGACHAARTEVHRDVMSRHSLFFQGNDVELGVLADSLGYRVGHIPFEVPTTVPDTLGPWLRQRLAWAGGEVRLFVANPQIAWRHPLFWTYGALVAIVGSAFRWNSTLSPGWSLLSVVAIYLALALYLHPDGRDRYLLLLPFYAAFTSLVITPLGLIWYVKMAWADRNVGLIRRSRGAALRQSWAAELESAGLVRAPSGGSHYPE